MSQVLDAIKGIRTNKIGDALEKFADIVSKVESNNENVRQEGGGPGRGFYQYEMQAGSKKPQGAKTALNRYKRFLDQNNLTMPESYARELKSENFDPNDPDFTKLSRELQTEIFYADKQKDPDFKLADLASGTLSYQNAWLDHHWKGPDKDREARIKHYNNEIPQPKPTPPLPEPRPERNMPPLPEPRPPQGSEKDFPPQAINPPPSSFRFDESSTIDSSNSDSTITGSAAEDSLDAQMAEAMGSDSSRYRPVPEENPTEGEPLNSRELLETPTQQEVGPAYTEEELAREAYVDPESTGDQTIGDMLRSFFGTSEEADTYEEPTGKDDPANFAEGGPVEKELEVTEDDLPDPPPGATPEEVADDIPAYLSTGEYVLPANVVRYYGLSRIKDLHQNALFELQQMEDLGMIQNVDHNGEEEDDDDEMSFIQEPETLLVIESSKGLMHPMHFNGGGGTSGGNDPDENDDPSMDMSGTSTQSVGEDPNAIDEQEVSEDTPVDVQDPAAMPTDHSFTQSQFENVVEDVVKGITRVGVLEAAHEFGLAAKAKAKEAGIDFSIGTDDDFSGFGKGTEIGGDAGSRGGGGDDPNISMADLTPETPRITTSVRRFIPGVGIIDTTPKRGIMRAANGGMAYVPGVGLLASQEALVEAGSGSTEPLSFEKFTADVFGLGQVPNVDTLGAEKALGEFTANKYKEYETQPPLSGQDLKNRNTLAREVTPSGVGGDQSAEASKEYAKDKELKRILTNRGAGGEDMAQVMYNFSKGARQILPNSSPLENEQLIAELGALARSRRISREGVDAKDIPEGATNRDVLKGIFAPQISSIEKYDSRNRTITNKENLIQTILTSDGLGEKYGYNLDDPADPSTLNKIVNFANTSTFSPEYTPKSKGLMSDSPTSQSPKGTFIPGVGLV